MDFPEDEQWRTRLLSEAEIAAALQKLSTEDAIELFQQQMLLRSQGLPEPVAEPETSPAAQAVTEPEPTPEPVPEAPVNPLFQTADLAEVLQQRATAAIPTVEEVEEVAEQELETPSAAPWPGMGATGLVDVPQPVQPQTPLETESPEQAADLEGELPTPIDSSSAAWWKLEEPENPNLVSRTDEQITDVITGSFPAITEPVPAPEAAPEPIVSSQAEVPNPPTPVSEPTQETFSTEEIAEAMNTPRLVSPAVHPFVPAPAATQPSTAGLDPAAQANAFIGQISAEQNQTVSPSGKTPEQIAAELNARFGSSKNGPDTGFLAAQIDHAAAKERSEDKAIEPQVNAEASSEPEAPAAQDEAATTAEQTREPFGFVSEPMTPAFIPAVSEAVAVPEAPVVELPSTDPFEADSEPAVEQLVSEFEEEHSLEPQPDLVDQTILAVGGQHDDISGNPTVDMNQPISESGSRPAISLLATWNGTGALVALSAIGFLAGSLKIGLLSIVTGGFVALVLSGLGFGLAALAARRGRQPQQVLARASFGVRGAIIPATLLVIARLVATAVVAVLAGLAIPNFFPNLQSTFDFSAGSVVYRVEVILPLLVILLLLGGLVSIFRGTPRMVVNIIVAVISVGGSGALLVLWLLTPGNLQLPLNLDLAQALGLGASVISVLGLFWGTSAADESPDLKSSTVVPKLIAVGLLNWTILGVLGLLGGFALSTLNLGVNYSMAVGIVYLVLAVFAIGNLTLRNAASFTGLGLPLVRGWLSVLSIALVAGFAAFIYLRLGADGLWTNVLGYLPAVGVPVVAWLGVVGADTALRRTDFHEVSLLRSYGFYGAFNWGTLTGWLIATVAGWGMISSNLIEFQWVGYLAKPLGLADAALSANLGIWIALIIGLITPFVTSIPRIRQQEREVSAIEARRSELLNVLGLMD